MAKGSGTTTGGSVGKGGGVTNTPKTNGTGMGRAMTPPKNVPVSPVRPFGGRGSK